MRTHENHDAALADALWWFRGFNAAHAALQATGGAAFTGAEGLDHHLREVRGWLKELSTGKRRVLGMSERERAIVLTEAEFERVLDGLRSTNAVDVNAGRATVEAVFAEVRAEVKQADEDEVAF
ncbi:hypothetical protein [Sphingomonas panaciterrae]|uniref:hypothetical protein n=1 Tax=Sphingomonas panaciterrae TaxID=1462999 RepID=UPI002FF31483